MWAKVKQVLISWGLWVKKVISLINIYIYIYIGLWAKVKQVLISWGLWVKNVISLIKKKNIYIYIYIKLKQTKLPQFSTSASIKKKKNLFKRKYIFENPNPCSALSFLQNVEPCSTVPLFSLFSTFSFPKTQHWKSILPRSHPHIVSSEIERRHHWTNHCPSRGRGYGYCVWLPWFLISLHNCKSTFSFCWLVSHNPKKPQTKQRSHESWSIVVDSRLVIKIGLLGSFMRNPNRFFEGFCLIFCLVADLSFFPNVLPGYYLLLVFRVAMAEWLAFSLLALKRVFQRKI